MVSLNLRMLSRSGPLLFALWLLPFSLIAPAVQAQTADQSDQVIALLFKMSKSIREDDYRGLFTYEFGGALQTLRITHRVMDGEEFEHLEYLNGPSRRIERSGRSVECLSPADQVMRGLLPALEGDYHGLTQHYRFYLRDDERIAGRLATVLQIVPRDDYRYGYTLSIDKKTFLPLSSMTINANRQVLERLQFADIELVPDDSWIGVVGATTDVQHTEWTSCEPGSAAMLWSLAWVPSGFVSAGHYRMKDVGEVQLFTDGLSAFSVFLSPMGKNVAAQGKAQRGATVAYMQQHMLNNAPYTVTVVGEIPARTAQRIASSLRWVQASSEVPAAALPTTTLPTTKLPTTEPLSSDSVIEQRSSVGPAAGERPAAEAGRNTEALPSLELPEEGQAPDPEGGQP